MACVHSIAFLVPGGIGCQAQDIYNSEGNAHETKHPEKKMKQAVAYTIVFLIFPPLKIFYFLEFYF
jgi:hypothetical protein